MEYRIVSGELSHHGILGMKWGVRRYQNADGSLTEAGKKRYNKENKTSEYYQDQADKHKKRAIRAGAISGTTALASIPASLFTLGEIAVASAVTPAALGGLTAAVLLTGTAAVSRSIAIGEAAVSAIEHRKAKKSK